MVFLWLDDSMLATESTFPCLHVGIPLQSQRNPCEELNFHDAAPVIVNFSNLLWDWMRKTFLLNQNVQIKNNMHKTQSLLKQSIASSGGLSTKTAGNDGTCYQNSCKYEI